MTWNIALGLLAAILSSRWTLRLTGKRVCLTHYVFCSRNKPLLEFVILLKDKALKVSILFHFFSRKASTTVNSSMSLCTVLKFQRCRADVLHRLSAIGWHVLEPVFGLATVLTSFTDVFVRIFLFKHQQQRAEATYMPVKSVQWHTVHVWYRIIQYKQYNRKIKWRLYIVRRKYSRWEWNSNLR